MPSTKPVVLVSVFCAAGNQHNQSLLQELAILAEFSKNFDFVYVTHNKTDKDLKKIEVESLGALTPSNTVLLSLAKFNEKVQFDKISSWREYGQLSADFIREMLYGRQIAAWLIYGGIMSETGGLIRKENKLDDCIDDLNGLNFNYKKSIYTRIITVLSFCNKYDVPIFHKMHDPAELSFAMCEKVKCNSSEYHGYDCVMPDNGPNLQRFDGLQYYYLKRDGATNAFQPKQLDFVFAAVTRNQTRRWLADFVVELENSLRESTPTLSTKIFYTDKYISRDEYINRNDYLELIAASKFTLIILSCEHDHFSIYRLIESLHHRCLPLIQRQTGWKHLLSSFDIEESIIEKILIDHPSQVATKMIELEPERETLIDYFREKLNLTKTHKDINLSNFLNVH